MQHITHLHPTYSVKRLPKMVIHTRSKNGKIEKPYEKPVILPEQTDLDPGRHAWADARFATDIMTEHGLFFALLMPEEIAPKERKQALKFSKDFAALFKKIDSSTPPARSELKSFVKKITEEIKPFVEYKEKMGEAQKDGSLRSLVWPLFFDHTRREAERWMKRLENLGKGEPGLERKEVAKFWNSIMEEHARFVAHLLDPDEYELIEKARKTSEVFRHLDSGKLTDIVAATASHPATVTESLIQNPEIDAIMSAAQTILDFKTKTARDIEMARIKSIIDPRLADHVRREALKFVDELKRAD
ncbi:MAG: hypothetical protein ACD_38C00034G0004 [uncultured bacterium]|uniref:DUF2935 domain-containing protein n=1 Tax=Candidatus Daviesbacteria bacterium GW2011_GWC2_40_12 TaxID=1618431 RepID=A0A0G0QKW6_9BACT|nr:MAG: hypothetical protein ACD_38C00034G0004 [uncultured bacterium]KKR16719.1 MAG: hypothetical protein UT45_C0004G0050 [Candidatus Daviesbacteria bacterium GW2011_GWA2_39_33]KKR25153.1 MAG: hypothetical protein UT54_C0006G0018 [Candidatus Daviesbacteria bacterium GW2011_GWB1_39_5]KKR41064.1 MAG: hypothetical protein UT77_C0016G0018 [Candidatus Daviesbacteria bacterium GW2011_GWC2_40_12]OGE21209.1 MAG: hypothetical protein A2778_03275 [Candidatus Daviesbacteria bacterium RIFCSPHIGHO2_01_FULL_